MGAVSLLHSALTVPAAFPPTVAEADAELFRDLEGKLPPGWVIEVERELDSSFDWYATIHGGMALSETPMFMVFRLPSHIAFLARWMDGSTLITHAFTTLAPVLDLIPSGIFAGAEARLANVKAEGWQDVRH